jgi:hypothetical protein
MKKMKDDEEGKRKENKERNGPVLFFKCIFSRSSCTKPLTYYASIIDPLALPGVSGSGASMHHGASPSGSASPHP